LADVVGVQPAALSRVRRGKGRPVGAKQQSLQQRWSIGAGAGGALPRTLLQDGVDAVPRLPVDDGLVLARIALTLVHSFADVGTIVQHPVDVLPVDRVAPKRAYPAPSRLTSQ